MLTSYAAFYNPVNLLRALPKFDKLWAERVALQIYGMVGVVKSVHHLRGWLRRLLSGQIERDYELPRPKFRMVVPQHVDLCLAHYGQAVHLPAPS